MKTIKQLESCLCDECLYHWQTRGNSTMEKAVMPFIAGLSTLVLCAAFIFTSTLEMDCTYQAIVRALPALMLAACIVFQRRQELFGEVDNKTNYTRQKKYFHFVAIGLVFLGIGDGLMQMEEHPQYKTKLFFLTGMMAQMIGHMFFMLRLSFRSVELKCQGGDKLNLAFVTFVAIVVLSQILPRIQNDILIKVCVVIYTFILGRHFYFSLILSNQEEKYYFSLLFDVSKMSKNERDGPSATFIKLMAQLFKGDIIGVKFGVKYYVVGASFMAISSVIVAYSRFFDATDRIVYIYSAYFPALVFTALSGLVDQACLNCFTRVIYNNMKVREGGKAIVSNGGKATKQKKL